MQLFAKSNNYKLSCGDMNQMLEDIDPNSIDSIVTDPPYGLKTRKEIKIINILVLSFMKII